MVRVHSGLPSILMASVYILQSRSTHKFYVGSALDLLARLAEHERGHSPYTRSRGPLELVYHEDFATLAEARRREQQLKSWKSHRSLEELITKSPVG